MKLRLAVGLALSLAGAGVFPDASADEPAASSVEGCAQIDSATERLACYDRFSGRAAAAAKPVTAAKPLTTAQPAPPTPSAAATSPVVAPAPNAVATPPISPQAAFGFYRAEHPVIATELNSMTANVVDFNVDRTGHQTLALDNGQWWRLDGADELLAKGNLVAIKRAALGSFILKTPTGRTYRAFRLK